MAAAPTGTVTLLFTDIEGSTRLLQRAGDAYTDLLTSHRELLQRAFAAHGGYEVDTEGDAFFVAFASAREAVAAAAEAQRVLAAHLWPEGQEVRVRMGLHTGEPQLLDGDYMGLDVHQAARVMAAGHGGHLGRLCHRLQISIAAKRHPVGLDASWTGSARSTEDCICTLLPERETVVTHCKRR